MSDLRVTNLRGRTSGKSPKMPNGAVVTGVATATSFSGNLTGNVTGNATGLSGTPNLNVGIITANSGVEVAGIVTAKAGAAVTYYGDGSGLTGVSSWEIRDTWLYYV